jgi:hypothetical protein
MRTGSKVRVTRNDRIGVIMDVDSTRVPQRYMVKYTTSGPLPSPEAPTSAPTSEKLREDELELIDE